MRISASLLLLAAVSSAAACHSYSGQADTDTTPVGFMGARWSATLTAQPGSPAPQVSGTATVLGNADSTQTRIDVSLTSAAPEAKLPWHLHRGSCGNDQGIVGDASAYTPLTVSSDGRATASATLDVPMPRSGEYMINIHASPTDMKTIVACGNLTGPSGS